jgi:MFS family permease
LIGSFFYFLSMLSLLFADQWWQVATAVVVFGFGHGLLVPSVQNLLVGFTTIKERAAFMSFNSMVLRIGQTIGPLLVGFFYTLGNLQGSFISGAAIAVLMFVVIAATLKR